MVKRQRTGGRRAEAVEGGSGGLPADCGAAGAGWPVPPTPAGGRREGGIRGTVRQQISLALIGRPY